jgi:hypothetical protein
VKFVSLASVRDYGFGGEFKLEPDGPTISHRYHCTGLHALGDDGQLYGYCVDYADKTGRGEHIWYPITADVKPGIHE